ncbi:hypothetical protein TNCV_2656551 [Trichonephila clavipes]|nr:hypothetical protein TNCV_2656551 [Trichonephila clavipes]
MIRFLWANNVSASDTHSQIGKVNGEETMGRQHVEKWCRSFQPGKQDRISKTALWQEAAGQVLQRQSFPTQPRFGSQWLFPFSEIEDGSLQTVL